MNQGAWEQHYGALKTGLHVRVSSDCVSSGHTSVIKNISNIVYGMEI